MKQLFLVLVVLGFTVPSGADVFIYSQKSAGAGIGYNSVDGWHKFKGTDTAYTIIGVDFADTNKVDIWEVSLTKVNGEKYAEVNQVGEVTCVVAQVGNKTIWIIGDEAGDGRFMVSGEAKQKKIDTGYSPVVASSLVGIAIWDQTKEGGIITIGSAKLTMTLNTLFTKKARELNLTTAETAAEGLLDYLETKAGGGYIPIP